MIPDTRYQPRLMHLCSKGIRLKTKVMHFLLPSGNSDANASNAAQTRDNSFADALSRFESMSSKQLFLPKQNTQNRMKLSDLELCKLSHYKQDISSS